MLGSRVTAAAARLLRRPKLSDAFYSSPEWRALVRDLIAAPGRHCEDPQCTTPNRFADQRTYGDHVHELKDGGAPLNPETSCSDARRAMAAIRRSRLEKGWRRDEPGGWGFICQMPTAARNRTDAHAQTARPAAFKKLGGNE
jgi:hypothetical protein